MEINLDLSLLRAIEHVVETRSFTAAAQELHSSQSALSHLIGKWERQTGIALFDRSHRPLKPTPAALLLSKRSAHIGEVLTDTVHALKAMQSAEVQRLFITLECHTCIEWLAPTLDAYRRNDPSVELDVRMGANFDPLPSLRAGGTDIVITSEAESLSATQLADGICSDPLFRYPIVALLRNDHPLAKRTFLSPRDFVEQTIITYPVAECRLDLYTRFLEPAGVVPHHRRTAELTTMIVQWVRGGAGLAALPQWALPDNHPDLSIIPLGKGGLWADLYALRREQDTEEDQLNAFIKLVRRECFAHLKNIRRIT